MCILILCDMKSFVAILPRLEPTRSTVVDQCLLNWEIGPNKTKITKPVTKLTIVITVGIKQEIW